MLRDILDSRKYPLFKRNAPNTYARGSLATFYNTVLQYCTKSINSPVTLSKNGGGELIDLVQ
jgi:hypothetical protein